MSIVFALAIIFCACGPSSDGGGGGGPDAGDSACDPAQPRVCSGSAVHACNSDGSVGELLEVCDESCSAGVCVGDEGCATGAELIYVVDNDNRLWSFDPQLLPGDPFAQVGILACPAGNSLPEFDPFGGQATPFSMSVDREATAWVLYTSGELFAVSTVDAGCQATGFQVGQEGFSLFGMGFVADAPGSDDETLFISGGGSAGGGSGDLGTISVSDLQVSRVGALQDAEYSPELTGTGDAELFGFFPGSQEAFVARIDRSSAGTLESWPLPAAGASVRAWAFAHWGGGFYIFLTTESLSAGLRADVLHLDRTSGEVETARADTGNIVVGAGVSTCAPVVLH